MTTKTSGPTITADGTFYYDDGGVWEPYIEYTTALGLYRKSPDQTRMVAELLLNEVLFCNSRPYVENAFMAEPPPVPRISDTPTLVLFCGCNDLFAWACSDAENVSMQELPGLYEAWRADKRWGTSVWCALKRGMRPQAPVERDMKRDGAWTDALEMLKLCGE